MTRSLRSLAGVCLALGVAASVASVSEAAVPAPTVSVDPRYAIGGKGIARTDFASNFASDTPNSVAVDGDRIYAAGEADGNVAILAQNATGGYDTGFSGDGKLLLPISADPSRDFAAAIIVLPDHRLRIVAGTDIDPATGTTNYDVALLGLMPDGTSDPTFTTTIFGVGPGDDTPRRAAYDAGTGRLAIVGSTKVNAQDDAFVAVRQVEDGTPAAFGLNGAVMFNQAGGVLQDEAVDVAWRPGGGVVALMKVQSDASTSPINWVPVLRGFTDSGQDDIGFSGGSTQIAAGQPPTTPAGLIAYGGRLWLAGSTKDSGETNAFVARVDADGSNQQSRMFDMRGQSTAAQDQNTSQGIDLAVLPGTVPTLVVVGSGSNPAGAAEWAAGAFNGLDGDLAAAGYGDLTIPFDSGQGAAVGIAAGESFLGVAGSLLVTSGSTELSFGTTRLVVDAEKECDLSLTIVRPLELLMRSDNTGSVRLAVQNKGKRICSGKLAVPAPYAFRGAGVDTGLIGPGDTYTVDLQLAYNGRRRVDDIIPIRLDAPGDVDTATNSRLIHVVFIYCDMQLSVVNPPSAMPDEGGQRVNFSVRNTGTTACREARIAALSGGKRSDAADTYTVAPARSVTDEGVFTLQANAPVGKRATLVLAARAASDAERNNDSVTLRPVVIGVGDSAVRSRSARSFTGVASRGRGPLKASQLRVSRVEVAVKQLGGTKRKPACAWLRSKSGRVSRGACGAAVWVRASGTSRWRLSLARALPAGRYEIRSRAVLRAGFREAEFSRKDANLVTLTVR